MGSWSLWVLFTAAFGAGIINSVAGGGAFLTFPALLLTGLDARAANITSTIALFPFQAVAGWNSRALSGDAPQLTLRGLFLISLGGGVIGALLLLVTPSPVFARMVPWLILLATGLFAYGSFVAKPAQMAEKHRISPRAAVLTQLAISIYGGYFGGGIGFLMLAALTLAGMPIRKAGATKNILAAAMNATAVLIFLFSPEVGWVQAGFGTIGALAGGQIGVRLLRHVNEKLLRLAVVIIGVALTIAMFWQG